MPKPARRRVCSRSGCGNIHAGSGQCPTCRRQADTTRPSGAAKYGTEHRTRFRVGVLYDEDGQPRECVGLDDGHHPQCDSTATVADHYPLDRTELIARGLDPDDPKHGRPLSASCHNRWTARCHGFGS